MWLEWKNTLCMKVWNPQDFRVVWKPCHTLIDLLLFELLKSHNLWDIESINVGFTMMLRTLIKLFKQTWF